MANWSKSMGPNFVPAYQVSGVPFVTSSTGVTTTVQRIAFPQATRFFQITNTGDTHIRFGFSENGVNGNPANQNHYFILSGGVSTERLELRCKELFIRADSVANASFSLIAGMSGVDASQFPTLTGSLFQTGSDGTVLPQAMPRFEGIG